MLLRLLRSGLLFLATCLGLYLVLFLVLCRTQVGRTPSIHRSNSYYSYNSGSNKQRFHEFDTAHHYDVLVLGSSHAYRGYDPARFAERGLELYNLGSSAQTPKHSAYLLEAYVDTTSTDLLILDLYAPTFMEEGLESTSLLTRHVPSDQAAWGIGLAQHDLRALNMLALRVLGPTEDQPLDRMRCYNGYCPQSDSVKQVVQQARPLPFEPLPDQLAHFRRALGLCRARKVPLVLVSHYQPSTSDHGLQRSLHALVMQEIAEHPNVHYIDLSYAHQADDRHHFFDHNHLNQAGVDLFNAQLIDSLSALGLVPH